MRIGFYLVWEKRPIFYDLARIMVTSAKEMMPDVGITQFTDEYSMALEGVEVARMPTDTLPLARSRHYMHVEGDWLFVDTDVVFRADVRDVFDDPTFDIAIADRNWPHAPVPPIFAKLMPHNAGVVFSRNNKFWVEVHNRLQMNPPQTNSDLWYGDQRVICDVIATNQFRTRVLPGMEYNYPPSTERDPAKGAKIVHCKGNRKGWMMRCA